MPGLSIVTTSVAGIESLEATLVSLLANQPADSEVLVVLERSYNDPYQLQDEVQFVASRRGQTASGCWNAGIAAAQGEIVCLIAPGVEVAADWTKAILPCFANPRVAAVAPLVLAAPKSSSAPEVNIAPEAGSTLEAGSASDPRVLSAGVHYRLGGTKRHVARGQSPAMFCQAPQPALGPSHLVGFYRREALEALAECFSKQLDAFTADVDLALRLRAAGHQALLVPESQVWAAESLADAPRSARAALAEERLFWRNAPLHGWGRSLLHHAFYGVQDLVASLPSVTALTRLGMRLWGTANSWTHRGHYAELARLRAEMLEQRRTGSQGLRVDHAHSATSPRDEVPASRRTPRDV